MKHLFFFIPFFCFFCSEVLTFADIIYFKDGTKAEVTDVWEEGDKVKCIRFGGEVSYRKDLIDRIEKGLTEGQKDFKTTLDEEKRLFDNPPEKYEELINAHLKKALFDPYSVQDLTIGKPVKITLKKPLFGLKPGQIIWACDVTYNAKNRYGAYTGIKKHIYFFRGNQIIDISD